MSKTLRKVLGISLSLVLLLSSLCIGSLVSMAASVEEDVAAAAKAYVDEKKNEATKDGFLAAVQSVVPEATLADADFYIHHAIPGVTDDDTTSGYPLNIPGSDGAVAAVFDIAGTSVGVAVPFAHDKQIVEIGEVAIVGESEGFTYNGNNVTAYNGTANKIVVPADYAGTIAGANGQTDFPGVEVVILANQVALPGYALANEADLVAVHVADGVTPDGTGYARRLWFNGDGQFKDCPKLKYIHLPEYCNVGGDLNMIPYIGFLRCSALENLNMPIYAGGYSPRVGDRAFEGTALRELQFSQNPHTPSGTISAVVATALADPTFAAGTRNVNFYNTPMTFVRAAALLTAAVNEQLAAEVEADAAIAAATAEVKKVPSANTAAIVDSLTVALADDVLTIDDGTNSVTASFKTFVPTVEMTLDEAVAKVVETFENGAWKNYTTAEKVQEKLQTSVMLGGYTVTVVDHYVTNAIDGAIINDETVVPGHNGYLAVAVKVEKEDQSKVVSLMYTIEPVMASYTFAAEDISTADEFELADDGKVLEYYTGDAKLIIVPDTVEEIVEGWYDGSDAGDVIALIVPDSVTTIPYSLCYAMGNLEVCSLGDGITEVMGFAFQSCWSLRYVKLPNNAVKLGGGVFMNTVSLEHVYFPASIKRIESKAFYTASLRDVTLGKNVEFVGDYAFAFVQTNAGEEQSKMTQEQIDRFNAITSEFNMYDRVITVLNEDLEIAARAAFGSDQSDRVGSRCVIRATADTTVFQTEQGRYPYCTKFYLDLDMTAAEVAVRAQVAADHLALTTADKAEDVTAMIADAYTSTKVKALSWAEDLAFDQDNNATGVLTVADDVASFNVVIDTVATVVEDNTGDDNTGDDNTGDDNTGDDNTGDDNTGDDNTGDDNTGGDNTGDDNGNTDDDNKSPVTGDAMPVVAVMLLVSAMAIVLVTAKKRAHN